MSTNFDVETGVMRMYDERGRTYLPQNIKDKLGVEEGDKIKLIVRDGEIQGRVIEDGDER